MTYEQALAALEERQETRIELGLDRVREHLARLGDPHARVPVFHVAGTNGKGATCAILSSVLRAAGLKTGLYISPHLLDVRERISINGIKINRVDFSDLMSKTIAADPHSRLTYFEILTSIAFQYFARQRCAVAVLETGMGGRLDATNVVTHPLAAVITSIGYDHQAYLGRTLSSIAAQKTGIFKPGRPAVFPDHPLLRRQSRTGIPFVVGRAWSIRRVDWDKGVQVVRASGGRDYRLKMLGARHGWNIALARTAVEASGLKISEQAWRKGLSSVRWPARFEVRRWGLKTLIIDGAHNPQAAQALSDTWTMSPWKKNPARWIIGVLRDKDARGFLKPLAPYLEDVVVVRPSSPRARDPLELAELIRKMRPQARITIEQNPALAVRAWRRDKQAPPTVLCVGSLYLAGDVLKSLRRQA